MAPFNVSTLKRPRLALLPALLLTAAVGVTPSHAFDASKRTQLAAAQTAAVDHNVVSDATVSEHADAAVIIEAEPINPPPTQEQLMQRFRDALGSPPSLQLTEHALAAGGIEVRSRYGRFCVNPPPAHSSSGPGGDITLAARCALF